MTDNYSEVSWGGVKLPLPLNCKYGKHKCKVHNYEHNYVQHTCGHEFCNRIWVHCPSCHGSGAENLLLLPGDLK